MTHDAQSALLRAALDAAARGWHVFPLRPGTKRPALHGEQ
ncbi:bifunctional DNA primase/polymerase, partial [Streptomyces rishiriensis]